jgi:hypothetical protein
LNLVCVDPARIKEVWPIIRGGVRSALTNGVGGLFSQTESDILSGISIVWLAVEGKDIRGVLVTDLVKTDSGLQCVIASLHGDNMRDWIGFLPEIEQFARKEGCTSIRMTGRKSWARVLSDYENIGIVMQKDLS